MELSRHQALMYRDYQVFQGELLPLCKAVEDIASTDDAVANAAYLEATRICGIIRKQLSH